MGANDHAIVVGITRYPSLSDLDGPELDASDFESWLLDAKGGNVPRAHVHTIVSSAFPPVAGAQPFQRQPKLSEVQQEFDALYAAGDTTGRVGDRLYIYLAGHGVARDIEDAALLMANAARGAVSSRHVSGRPYANWFRQAAFFREVVLFMDCCREAYTLAPMLASPRPYEPRNGNPPGTRYFGFATQWARAAREASWAPAEPVRGIFTVALLAGLREGAPRDANGRVTGADLGSYVINYVRSAFKRLPLEDRPDPEFDYNPAADVLFNPPPGEPASNVVPAPAALPGAILTGGAGGGAPGEAPSAAPGSLPEAAPPPPPTVETRTLGSYLVRIQPANGASYELRDGAFKLVRPETRSPALWTWRLTLPGLYKLVKKNGPSTVVEVTGDEEVIDAAV
jgi:hypothetical protein